MFRLERNFIFERKINLALPSGEQQDFLCSFRLLDEECFAQQLADENDPDRAILENAIVGWKGIENNEGKNYNFSPQNLQRLLELPFVKRALTRAYVEGIKGSLEKN